MYSNSGLTSKQKVLIGTIVFALVWTLMATVMELNHVMAKDESTGCIFLANVCLEMTTFKDWYTVGVHMLNFALFHALVGSAMGFTASGVIAIIPHRHRFNR